MSAINFKDIQAKCTLKTIPSHYWDEDELKSVENTKNEIFCSDSLNGNEDSDCCISVIKGLSDTYT